MSRARDLSDLLSDGGVTSEEIVDSSIATEDIADGAITADKIADGAAVPDQTGHSGKFLTTNGTDASWGVVDTSNGDTAFSWGDHSTEGYLTSETDPVFSASHASTITPTHTTNWNAAYNWGDHSLAGYNTTATLNIGTRSTGPYSIDLTGSTSFNVYDRSGTPYTINLSI